MKVGDYVRTKYGIGKYIDDEIKSEKIIVIDRYIAYDHMDDYKNVITPSEIIKSSPNIIDLIEVGDYVNGLPARFIEKDRLDIGQAEDYLWLKNEHIKSIVTKEQFEAMEYKVESEVN